MPALRPQESDFVNAPVQSGVRPRNWLDCRGVPEHECGADDPSQECCGLNVNHTISMIRATCTEARDTQTPLISSNALLSGRGVLLTCWLLNAGFVCGLSAAAAGLTVGGLQCECLENPLGIDRAQPRLGGG